MPPRAIRQARRDDQAQPVCLILAAGEHGLSDARSEATNTPLRLLTHRALRLLAAPKH